MNSIFIKRYVSGVFMLFLLFSMKVTAEGAEDGEVIIISVPPGQEYVAVDQMDGVDARYREGTGNDITGTYSCAGYVARYYQTIYGITVNNQMDAGPPHPVDKLVRVSVPQKGDIIFYPVPPNRYNHSAIVKSFDGVKITLIEQNFKWMVDGVTYAYVNRKIDYPDSRYEIYRAVSAPVSSVTVGRYTQPAVPLSEQELIAKLDFRESTDIQFSGENGPGLISAIGYDTGSFGGLVPYSFTVPLEFDICIYYEVMGDPREYKLAYPGETITASSAVFRRPATVPAFAQSQPEPVYKLQAVITMDNPVMIVNGEEILIDAPAYIENSRTMLPVKWISSALGISDSDILWDEPTKTVIIINGEAEIKFTIGSNILIRSDGQVIMDTASVIHMDRAYLPVRYLADALGVTYRWDDEEKSLTLLAL